jgi:hypothetical protein
MAAAPARNMRMTIQGLLDNQIKYPVLNGVDESKTSEEALDDEPVARNRLDSSSEDSECEHAEGSSRNDREATMLSLGLKRQPDNNTSCHHDLDDILEIPELRLEDERPSRCTLQTPVQTSVPGKQNVKPEPMSGIKATPLDPSTLFASSASWSLPLQFENILREGWLHKVGGLWPASGGRRWFTARLGSLVYVRWPGDRRKPRSIPLGPVARITMSEAVAGRFAIVVSAAGREHRLEHSDRQEAFDWMRAISRAAEHPRIAQS